ncbi:MAG TPA: SBBP repeat-containing protein [Terriglobales bacterium]|nr:SBBP repeat-containing protein [Terriglobales bacterium]
MFRTRIGFLIVLIPIVTLFSLAQSSSRGGAMPSAPQISRQFIGLPLAFEINRGQAAADVDFVARGQGYSAQLHADHVTLGLTQGMSNASGEKKTTEDVVDITLAGVNGNARAAGEGKLAGHSNYLLDPNPAEWITEVEQYARVRYANVYPGIDLVFHGNQSRLENDFVVYPGADAQQIGLTFSGIHRIDLQSSGDLALQAESGEIRLQKPRAYQVIGGKEVEVTAEYALRDGHASFHLGRYDTRRELIIDPVLLYSTFLGGPAGQYGVNQQVSALAVDASGNLYVTGPTDSTGFPVTPGVVQPTPPPTGPAVFVSKLDPTGTSLIFSTYMTGFYYLTGLAVDTSGNVYVAGVAASGLPIPSGSNPFQNAQKGSENLAILKLNSAATVVLAATYLGGSGRDGFGGLAIDSAGDVYVTGGTTSNDFPVQNPLQGALGNGGANAFLTELNPTLSALVYSTYLGQNSTASANAIALDTTDNAYVVGDASPGFPTTSGSYQTTCPGSFCPFLAELNSNASSILYATYLSSGDNRDQVTAVAVDRSENAYLAGTTYSASFPEVNPIQSCSAINGTTSPSANFLSEFSAAGTLVFSTCLGIGAAYSQDYPSGPVLALDASGNAYLAGSSTSSLPLQNPIDDNPPAVERPFVSEVGSTAHALVFSSFVAGPVAYSNDVFSTGDSIGAIGVDSDSNVYLAGGSTAGYAAEAGSTVQGYSYLPVFNALQSYFVNDNTSCSDRMYCTYTDGFIMKISPTSGAAAGLVPAELQFPPVAVGATSSPQGTTIYDLGTDNLMVSNVEISGDFAIQSNNCGTVPASGGSCAIAVTFTPTAMGTRNGTLTITDSSAGSPHVVVLTGQGSTNNLTVSPTSLSFPGQLVGTTSSPQTVTLTAGVVAVGSLHLQASGDFSETNSCGTGVAAFGTCQVYVTFTPTTTGARTGTLTMTDNAPNSPQTVSLTGTGMSPGLGLNIAPGGSSSATVAAGSTAKYSLSIGGHGLGGTASLSCTGAPMFATCVAPATQAVSATTATAFDVSVTTTSATTGAFRLGDFPSPWLWALALMGGVVLLPVETAKWLARRCLHCLPLLLFLFLCSCGGSSNAGGGGSSNGTLAGTYTLTVTAKVGSTSQPITLNLTVQ